MTAYELWYKTYDTKAILFRSQYFVILHHFRATWYTCKIKTGNLVTLISLISGFTAGVGHIFQLCIALTDYFQSMKEPGAAEFFTFSWSDLGIKRLSVKKMWNVSEKTFLDKHTDQFLELLVQLYFLRDKMFCNARNRCSCGCFDRLLQTKLPVLDTEMHRTRGKHLPAPAALHHSMILSVSNATSRSWTSLLDEYFLLFKLYGTTACFQWQDQFLINHGNHFGGYTGTTRELSLPVRIKGHELLAKEFYFGLCSLQ